MIGDLVSTGDLAGARKGRPSPEARADDVETTVRATGVCEAVARCVLGQIHRAYPCAEAQTLETPDDLSLPSERHPAFFGSFDWHSCMHSHWALVRMLTCGAIRDERLAGDVVRALGRTFQPALVAREAAAWERLPAHVELPYGLTWLLALDAELAALARRDGHGGAWRAALAPLVRELAPRVRAWAAGLRLPVRSGIHSDTAWSLAQARDWAAAVGDDELVAIVDERAVALYARDRDAPCAYEPSGQTFTSPILNEAALMARALPAPRREAWLRGFLPTAFSTTCAPAGATAHVATLANTDAGNALAPLLPDAPGTWDGVDYLGVHEVALPLARCLAVRDAACALPAGSPARASLLAQARRWRAQGLAGVTLDGYLADHWIGSFMVATVLPAR